MSDEAATPRTGPGRAVNGTQVPGPRPRVRAGGRSEKVRRAVAAAVLGLLAEGRVAFGPGEVAERAGVTRRTIYRWWPTYEDLVREGLAEHSRTVDPPDTGSWPEDVRQFAARVAEFFAGPVEVGTNAVMAGRRDPELSRIILEHFEPVLASWHAMVERGIERGEVAADCDPALVVNMLASPLMLAPLMLHRAATADEVAGFAELLIRATTPAR